MTAHKDNQDNLDDLREKLAAIEHERWADWQNWVHKVYLEGNFKEFMLRWQKQIATPYSELTEAEKNSDREQVDRYWHLITAYTQEAVVKELEWAKNLSTGLPKSHVGRSYYTRNTAFKNYATKFWNNRTQAIRDKIDQRIKALTNGGGE